MPARGDHPSPRRSRLRGALLPRGHRHRLLGRGEGEVPSHHHPPQGHAACPFLPFRAQGSFSLTNARRKQEDGAVLSPARRGREGRDTQTPATPTPGAGRGGGGGTATWRGAEPGAQLVASLCAPPAPQTRSPPPPARRGAQRLGWVQCVGAGVAQGGSSAKPGSLGIHRLTPPTRCCREPPDGLMAGPLRPQGRAGGAPTLLAGHSPGFSPRNLED